MTITDSRLRLATQKQFDFIKSLLAERTMDLDLAELVEAGRALAVQGMLESHRASEIIERLLAAPKKTDEAPAEEPEAGVYVVNGDHYVRVYWGQQSGRMLAKRIHMERDGEDWTVTYEYLGAASRVLVPANTPLRLSLEEVGSLGITTNHCLLCGRRLDDPESVDRGIGPVCAGKY